MNADLPLKLMAFCFVVGIGNGKNAFPGENKWTLLKPSAFRGPFNAIAINPTDPDILFASLADTGILKSNDGGKTWYLKKERLIIEKIVIDPFRPDTVYACSQNGLYRSVNGGDEWSILSGLPNTIINAVATAQRSRDTLYAAIGEKIYRSSNGGDNWQHISGEIRATIRALVVSRVKPRELYVGTDAGVYKIRDIQNSYQMLYDPNAQPQKFSQIQTRKAIDLVVDPFHTKVVFALFEGPKDSTGVWWAYEEGEGWNWWEMNEGFDDKERFFPLLGLSLDPKHPRVLHAVNRNGDIFQHEFTFPQIGVLDFGSTTLPDWELAQFSQHLVEKLRDTHRVNWFSKKVVNEIDSTLTQQGLEKQTTAMSIGNKFGIEYVLGGELHVVSGKSKIDTIRMDTIRILPAVTFVVRDTQTALEYEKPILAKRFDYMPYAIDAVVKWFYETIKFPIPTPPPPTPAPLPPQPSNGKSSKRICLGALLGFGIGYTVYLIFENDEEEIKDKPKLPLPPRFP